LGLRRQQQLHQEQPPLNVLPVYTDGYAEVVGQPAGNRQDRKLVGAAIDFPELPAGRVSESQVVFEQLCLAKQMRR